MSTETMETVKFILGVAIVVVLFTMSIACLVYALVQDIIDARRIRELTEHLHDIEQAGREINIGSKENEE